MATAKFHDTCSGVWTGVIDSFSDGGRLPIPQGAVLRGMAMVAAGADITMSAATTRPGAQDVVDRKKSARVVPVIAELAAKTGVPIYRHQ